MLKEMLGHLYGRLFNRGQSRAAAGGAVPQERLFEGIACMQRGDLAGAERTYRAILGEDPGHAQALHLLGYVVGLQGRWDESVALLTEATGLSQDDADLRFNLARSLRAQRRLEEAGQSLREALRLRPHFVEAWVTLGDILVERGRLDEAEDCYREGLLAGPEFAEGHYNYGNLLHREGRIAEAIASYRTAVEIRPDFVRAHSNLVYALNFSDDYSPEEIFHEHVAWARRHADPLSASAKPHANLREPGRVLRVGYVSPNFRDHAVTYFFEPVLMRHDPARVTVCCYSDVERPDSYTERLRSYQCVWRETFGLSDDAVADMVRKDGIDILVDLTGHTDGHRLLVFARRPAPLQITWNGYANTTGMSAMDYRVTDAYADPPGATDHLHSERLIRLPEIYMPFLPPAGSPEVCPPPILRNGYPTFGSFNAISKLGPRVIEVWCRLLQRVPQARLLLFTVPEGRARKRLEDSFASHGIDAGRIEFRGRLPFAEFLGAHAEADVALDPFPFAGTTTTCHSLWMGVPVVSLAGRSHVSRVGVSMLSNLKLERLVARDEEDYIAIAAELVQDADELSALRIDLRSRMAASPNTDGARLTRFLEQAYAAIWAEYCMRANTGHP